MSTKMGERDVQALARMLDRMDYYKLLRLDRQARSTQVRSGYHRMRRCFHPDLYLYAPPDLREAVDQIARRITEAYSVLRDANRRKAYDESLTKGQLRYTFQEEKETRTQSLVKLGVSAQARGLYGRMVDAERRGDLKNAIASLKLALTFEPNNKFFGAKLEDLQRLYKEQLKKEKPEKPSYDIR
jgi:DnaJ-class molecular chaperone